MELVKSLYTHFYLLTSLYTVLVILFLILLCKSPAKIGPPLLILSVVFGILTINVMPHSEVNYIWLAFIRDLFAAGVVFSTGERVYRCIDKKTHISQRINLEIYIAKSRPYFWYGAILLCIMVFLYFLIW